MNRIGGQIGIVDEIHIGDQILIGDQIPIGGQTVIGGQIRRGGEVVHGLGLSGAVPGGACGDHLRVIGAEIPALIRCAIRRVTTRSQSRESARTLGLAGVPSLLRDTGSGEPEHPAMGHPAATPAAIPFWPAAPTVPWLLHQRVRRPPAPEGGRRRRLGGRCVHGWPAPCCCSPCWPRRPGVALRRLPTSSPPPLPGRRQRQPSPPYCSLYSLPFRSPHRPLP